MLIFDVRTRAEIYRIAKRPAEDGIGIVLVSSELAELRRCASRILAIHAGRVTDDFDVATTSTERLVAATFGREPVL